MQTLLSRPLAGALAAAALTLAGAAAAAAPAAAAPAAAALEARASVQAGRLILDPTDRGYRGTLPVTVTNRGRASTSFSLKILEPVAGSFRDAGPDAPCLPYDELTDGRRTFDCSPSLYLRSGETKQAFLTFEVLTTVRSYPMRAGQGTIEATVAGQQSPAGTATFGTLFRSSKGKLRPARPYVQDAQAKASISAGDATMTRAETGRWFARVPVTVRWSGDAAHDNLWVGGVTLPNGVQLWTTEPDSGPADWLEHLAVPGKRFMPGEERSFTLVVSAPADRSAADVGGPATLEVGATFWPTYVLPEATPADNTVVIHLTAVE
ncbi:hypothetical protein GCM10011608_02220 [Micromonospora sonchi]|uniref:DUF916 domain-containing protein n=1 Tax=Micromonospora sonchi TaxID=1763543 RepID=A0A917TFU9_9ACTN|nr:hypothetical protein [Micromonospora sonchi]GGM21144.1 hypothetical protein GCM10011608_02220 [Micromonospora sonchi]